MPRDALTSKPAPNDTPAWAAELTPREQRFVSEFVVDLNATEAAIRSGLGKTRKSATEIACRLRRKQSVMTAINALVAERSGATKSRVIEELGKLAFSDLTDVVAIKNGCVVVSDTDKLTPDQRAAIVEISETVNESGRTIRVKMADKLAALDKLAKVLGMYREREAPPDEESWRRSAEALQSVRERIIARMEAMRKRFEAEEGDRMAILPPPTAPQRAPAPPIIIDAERQ